MDIKLILTIKAMRYFAVDPGQDVTAPVAARFTLLSLDERGNPIGNIGVFRVTHYLDANRANPLVLSIDRRTASYNNSTEPAKGKKVFQLKRQNPDGMVKKDGHVRYGLVVDDGVFAGGPQPLNPHRIILNYSWDVHEDDVSVIRNEAVPLSGDLLMFGSW